MSAGYSQRLPQGERQVAHLVEGGDAAAQPVEDLFGAVGRLTERGHERGILTRMQ